MKQPVLEPVKWKYANIVIEYIPGGGYPYMVYYFQDGKQIMVDYYSSFEEAFSDVKLLDIILRIEEAIGQAIEGQNYNSDCEDMDDDKDCGDNTGDKDKVINRGIELGLKKAKAIIEHNYFPEKAQNSKL